MKKRFLSLFLAVLLVGAAAPFTASAAVWTDVATWDQLKAAVENSTTTHIRFTSDIEFPLKTATINTAKPELVIDGNSYTLTDSNSASLSYALRYNKKGNLKNITVQNMNIVGRNYYGMITIDDSTAYSDVTVTFDNITYAGPGLSWGRKSNFVIRDSYITVVPSKVCPAHEIFECLRVRLEGYVNIVKDAPSSCEELFWITGANGGVTVASGANVTVENNQVTSKTKESGFVYFSCANIHIIFEDDSQFSYAGNNLFQQGDAVDTVIVGKRANVDITLNGELFCSYGVFHCRGTMLFDEDSTFRAYAFNNKAAEPLVQLRGTAVCTFNRPYEVFLYNSSTNTCNTGLAMGPYGCDVTYNFNDVRSIEYWKLNTAPYTSLPAATKDWRNPDNTSFGATERVVGATVKSASATGYSGVTPFNTTTAVLKDINVVRINGGVNMAAKVTVGGTITWDDNGDPYGNRPASVEIALFRNGDPLQAMEVTSSAGSYAFTDLPKYAPDGTEYVYTISERDIYPYEVRIDGYNIVNILYS